MSVLSTLAPTTGLIFAIQAIFAVPGIVCKTEKYYDMSGGLTFLAASSYALAIPALRARVPLRTAACSLLSVISGRASGGNAPQLYNWRHVALTGAVSLWSIRLSTHLFSRIRKTGHDSRFDTIKQQPSRFSVAWLGQCFWVTFSLLPLTLLAAVPASALSATVTTTDIAGLALWASGWLFEIAADAQKSRWVEEKKRKLHDEEFLTRGLWGKCRYPNYAGEIALWTGLATVSGGMLMRKSVLTALGWGTTSGLGAVVRIGMVMAPFLSPAFVALLLLKVSGVPMSQGKYDKKFGNREDYRKWRNNTPLLLPKLW